MPRRTLTEDERELWQRIARTARRRLPQTAPQPAPSPEVARDIGPVADPGQPRRAAPAKPVFPAMPAPGTRPAPREPLIRLDLAEPLGERLAREPVRMDHGLHARMVRGKLEPEARIDLHGMTVAQAHAVLTAFLAGCHARGLRLVLVITGKGRTRGPDHAAPMPVRAGVLKHEVPHWLRSAPLASMVLDLREAHRSHGGSGAYYVYLRKRR